MSNTVVKLVPRDVGTDELREIEQLLGRLGGIDQAAALKRGMAAAGNVVKRKAVETAPRRISKRKPDEKSISLTKRGSIRVVTFVRENEPVLEVRVKAARRAPHLHLIEVGHDIVVGGSKDYGRTSQGQGLEFDARLGRVRKRAHRGSSRSRLAAKSRRTGERGNGAIVGRVPPSPYLNPAGNFSQAEQKRQLMQAAKQAITDMILKRKF